MSDTPQPCGRDDCDPCGLERTGCVHQRKTSEWVPEWDDGCFVCQPESYERPRCNGLASDPRFRAPPESPYPLPEHEAPTHGTTVEEREKNWQGKCHYCGKPTEYAHNYCSGGDCIINAWRASGAKEHLPNGLPIRCMNANPPLLLECEHGDHPDYLFPVDVDCTDEPEVHDGFEYPNGEFHALIYTDGYIALTLYECEYHLWGLSDGAEMAGENRAWRKDKYRLSPKSLAKVIEWAEQHGMYHGKGIANGTADDQHGRG